MRLSLKALFAILTISCLTALVYQEKNRIRELADRNAELNTEIAGYAPNLEKSLEYLRIASRPDEALVALHGKALEIREAEQQEYLTAQTKDAKTVGVIHLPDLEKAKKRFAIFVPKNKRVSFQVFASNNPFEGKLKDALAESVFDLSKTIDVRLESGLSNLTLRPSAQQSENEDTGIVWNLGLNGEVIATVESKESGFSGGNLIWLMSKQKFLTLRHQNISKLAAYFLEPQEAYLEFAAVYSTDFYKKIGLDNNSGAQPTYLKFALSIEDEVKQ